MEAQPDEIGPTPFTFARGHGWLAATLLLAAIALPWVLDSMGADYYLSLASRIVVYAIAATSLNLVLGYGGMVSFGHAAFVGLGAYVTAIMISQGVVSGFAHGVVTVAITGTAALLIGAISLRTRGVYFIMITLAFAQMLYYLIDSVKGYGGDEGLNIKARSIFDFGMGLGNGSFGIDLKNPVGFYYVALAVLALSIFALMRFVPSRFGRAVLALRDDEVRAEALGFPTYRYKLTVFVVAAALAGVAGALSVNLTGYVSPNALHWTQSGTLLVMVILGGVASIWGGALGAVVLLLLQESLASVTPYWEFWIGWVLLAVVLFARNGLVGLLSDWLARRYARRILRRVRKGSKP